MAPLRAVLLFPVRPAAAADAIARAPWTAMLSLVPPLALFLYLVARGCAPADAGVTALAALALIGGLAGGGAVAATVARRLVAHAPRHGAAVPLVFAAWACVLFGAMLALGGVLGIGAVAPLAAGLALLVWGVVVGTRLAAGDDVEPGRALVAACVVASGAVVGLVLAGYLVITHAVMAMPAPVAVAGGSPGDALLVRRGSATPPGNIAVARDARTARILVVRTQPNGRLVPLDGAVPSTGEECPILGRVFFRFGGAWGGQSLP